MNRRRVIDYVGWKRDRFNRSYMVASNGCWEWTRYCAADGYGSACFMSRVIAAHRLSWILHRGEVPVGKFVLHTCDNRRCVNPGHLWIGTLKDNAIDMHRKSRNADIRGEKNHRAKLTAEAITRIRNDRRLLRLVAADHGVSQSQICLIKNRKAWRHI